MVNQNLEYNFYRNTLWVIQFKEDGTVVQAEERPKVDFLIPTLYDKSVPSVDTDHFPKRDTGSPWEAFREACDAIRQEYPYQHSEEVEEWTDEPIPEADSSQDLFENLDNLEKIVKHFADILKRLRHENDE